MGPRTGLDNIKKWKFLTHRDSYLDSSVIQPTDDRCADFAIAALNILVNLQLTQSVEKDIALFKDKHFYLWISLECAFKEMKVMYVYEIYTSYDVL